jgi:hypothetical protein
MAWHAVLVAATIVALLIGLGMAPFFWLSSFYGTVMLGLPGQVCGRATEREKHV